MRINWKKRLGVYGSLTLLCLMALAAAPLLATAAGAQTVTAELDVQNRLIHDNGDPSEPADFFFTVDSGSGPGSPIQFNVSGTNQLFLDVSLTYTIRGVPRDNFLPPTYSSCDNVTLVVGEPHICQITNDDIPPPTTTTTTTTTTTQPRTVTTQPAGQTQIHGSLANANKCTIKLVPELAPNGPTDPITVTLASDAAPQPHLGDPITLSNTTLGISVPAGLIQKGVNVGLINNGFHVHAHLTVVVAGSNTTQGTHQYSLDVDTTIRVKPGGAHGIAQPLSATLNLPDTHWTPVNATDDVLFTEKSLKIFTHLGLAGLSIDVTFRCAPSTGAYFVALGATGLPVNTTPSSTPGGGGSGSGSGSGGTTAAAAVGATGGSLPRTGSNPWPLLVLAAVCIDLGMLAIAGARRGRRRLANR